MSFLDLGNKTFVVFGVANKRSIAWGIAEAMHAAGARQQREAVAHLRGNFQTRNQIRLVDHNGVYAGSDPQKGRQPGLRVDLLEVGPRVRLLASLGGDAGYIGAAGIARAGYKPPAR